MELSGNDVSHADYAVAGNICGIRKIHFVCEFFYFIRNLCWSNEGIIHDVIVYQYIH